MSESESRKQQLFEAIADGDLRTTIAVLEQSPQLLNEANEGGYTPLMEAVSSMDGSLECIEAIVQFGADVNAMTDEGYTALHMFVGGVNGPSGTGDMPAEIVKVLVNAGANMEVRQHWGWTPLMRAVVEGTVDELRALIDAGGDPNRLFPNNTLPAFLRGHTTLMAAIGDPDKVQLLIDAGANLTAKDNHGQTILMYAHEALKDAKTTGSEVSEAISKELEEKTLRSLSEMGIDDSIKDEDGKTALDHCREALNTTLNESSSYDFERSVRQSIKVIRQAMGQR